MLCCMRTTIEISDELLRQAKKRAADEKTPLGRLIEAALRSYLSGRPRVRGYKLHWRTEKGRLHPGINLTDCGALLDLMEGRS